MTQMESILEGLVGQLLSPFTFRFLAVTFVIALFVVLVIMGIQNFKGILFRTGVTMAILCVCLFVIIVSNVAMEHTDDEKGIKRMTTEAMGLIRFMMRSIEKQLFPDTLLHEL